ncbi:hypothetical protein FGIG_00053 [Fasciola gigantica]|uniref:Uncharacterized protein n=1 Tax=Fasciola gigantica TaxID=46835 RepID=A0A504YBT0_FASGI|nr:hypothetical protein FGIG_00053 [Fasciola gigantica]
MDAMERSHTFESAVVSSLFNARQMIWTELSSVISERDAELNRLVAENQSLSSILKRFREIAEGKELEINGLRRQLQGFYSGRPICSSCSRPITPIKNACKSSTVSDDDKKGDLGGCSRPHFLGPIEARKRDRLNASLSSNSVEQIQTNPRDIVISWLGTGKNFRGRRPSEKRPCVRASLSSLVRQPIVLVKDTEASESPFDGSVSHSSGQTPTNVARSPERTMNTNTFGLDNLSGSPTENRNNVENVSGVGPEGNLGIAKLSPPSESYDASLAIRNAVNHLDLANYENTLVEFTHSQASQAEYNRVGESSRHMDKVLMDVYNYYNVKSVERLIHINIRN